MNIFKRIKAWFNRPAPFEAPIPFSAPGAMNWETGRKHREAANVYGHVFNGVELDDPDVKTWSKYNDCPSTSLLAEREAREHRERVRVGAEYRRSIINQSAPRDFNTFDTAPAVFDSGKGGDFAGAGASGGWDALGTTKELAVSEAVSPSTCSDVSSSPSSNSDCASTSD